MLAQLQLFQSSLPAKPYCTDVLEYGLQIRSTAHALGKRYIQPNHPNSKLWLLFDIDRGTAPDELTDDLNLPCPTIWVQNPQNGHAHALYALNVPVHLNPDSSARAIRFFGAVDVALSQGMDADPGYAGLVCKNPANEHWRTYGLAGTYDLTELSEYLDLSAYGDRRKKLPEIGLGRNVTLFERLRTWAYRAIRQGWPDYSQWLRACEDRARGYNNQFPTPLHWSEVAATAKSVAKWTHTHLSPSGFSAWQSAQGRKGGVASGKTRRAASENRRSSALLMRSQGLSIRAIAAELGVAKSTVSDWVSGEAISDSSRLGARGVR